MRTTARATYGAMPYGAGTVAAGAVPAAVCPSTSAMVSAGPVSRADKSTGLRHATGCQGHARGGGDVPPPVVDHNTRGSTTRQIDSVTADAMVDTMIVIEVPSRSRW